MPYKQIHLKVITLRNDFPHTGLTNLDLMAPPVFKPQELPVQKHLSFKPPIKIGFLVNSVKKKISGSF